jgi:hypothetical protein
MKFLSGLFGDLLGDLAAIEIKLDIFLFLLIFYFISNSLYLIVVSIWLLSSDGRLLRLGSLVIAILRMISF